eukprot:CAMPEP_0185750966 /NCGR_PEP_ID=MMETSP1174-20130828/9719_1 /TAXON_ID=35687 /ORGANISM="Dictyocha speculum, Strain CCMP1381" /LENGTH=103 /DNA_ID=CAMNT_0028427713 /DNA_START=45 /DNA_END=352 /DNA_ORIENTATION=+
MTSSNRWGPVFDAGGTVDCRTCGMRQSFTTRNCERCGSDPWADTSFAPTAPNTLPPPPYAPHSPPSSPALDEQAVRQLVEMGIKESEARRALVTSGNDVEAAL